MSLRILHTLPTVDSGAEDSVRDVIELAAAQRKFGHEMEIVSLGRPESDGLGGLGVTVHRLPRSRLPYGYSAEFVRWMKAHATRFDCVIIHGVFEFNSYGAWLALRDMSIPYFVFTHGMLEPWAKLHHQINHFRRWFYWPWGGYPVLRDAHAVLFLSDHERHRSQETFWLYDCHEFVVRFGTKGIPSALPDRGEGAFFQAHPPLRGRRLFTYLGCASGRGGADALIRALAQLRQRGAWQPEAMKLVLANVPASGEKALRALAARLGVSDSVYWAGAVADQARWGLLSASEVLLRPSDFEASGRVVAEALSADTPALMSFGVMIWKDVVNEGAGMADEETPEGFARLLHRWLTLSEDERSSMRRTARHCFENRFTLDGAANTLTAAIYLLVGVHRDGRWDLKPLKPASELL